MRQGQVRPSPPLSPVSPIDAAWVEAVALRVVQLMRNGSAPNVGRLVDAATLAAELGITRSWVYQHRDELGAVRLGTGSKPRLRFNVEVARAALGQERYEPLASGAASPRSSSSRKLPPSTRRPPVGRVLTVKARRR
jgi:hypothetical protein